MTASGALTLISDATTSLKWTAGDGVLTDVPTTGNFYLGNPWFCPGTPSSAYILFQAQNGASGLTTQAQPGGGYDNDIWLYRPATSTAPPKVWQLTNYGTSVNYAGLTATTPGPGVLGPQCSQDSSSSANQLHIVYGHVKPYAPTVACSAGQGPSTGTCWWYGEWELVFGDVNFDPMTGDPAVDPACTLGGCQEPYLVHNTTTGAPYHVNPRDQACSPTCAVSGGTGSATLTGNVLMLPTGTTLGSGVVGAGIALGRGTGNKPFYTVVTCFAGTTNDFGVSCSGTSSVTLQATPPGSPYPPFDGSFVIKNYVVYEPHWYVSNLGKLYFTANRTPTYHDGVGVLYGFSSGTSTPLFQELESVGPPYLPGGTTGGFINTYWNEFVTPDPSGARFLFMSDRASPPGSYSTNPEASDHFICTGLNCSNIARLTYYNPNGADSALATPPSVGGVSCYPITAVRGAWSPDSSQYMTLVEYLARADCEGGPPGAVLYKYTFNFPTTEVSGHVTSTGHVKLGQ